MRSMHRTFVVLAWAGALVVAARPAAAEDYSVHVVTNAQTGWTDNLYSTPYPEDRPPDQPGLPAREPDFYTMLTPGVLFTYDAHRHIHELFYELDAAFYVEHPEAWSLAHRAGWRGNFLISPLTDLTTSAVVAGGTLNTFTTTTTAADGTVQPLPSAESRFASFEGRGLLTREINRNWRMLQDSVVRGFSTSAGDDDMRFSTTGAELGAGVSAERSWEVSAVALRAGTTYAALETVDQMTASALASWRRDLDDEWSSSIEGGVVTLVPLGEGQRAVIEPAVGAHLGYYPEWGSAGISARRSVAPNLVLGANAITDAVTVNAALPLPWLRDRMLQPRLTIGASGGYARTSVLDPDDGTVVTRYDNLLADAAISYRFGDQTLLSARYQYIQQDVDDNAIPNVFAYTRNTVLVTFTMRWPSRVAAEVPDRETLRVSRDQNNEVGGAGGAGGGTDRR